MHWHRPASRYISIINAGPTCKLRVEQLSSVAEQDVGEDPIYATQEEVVGVYQVVTDQWIVTCQSHKNINQECQSLLIDANGNVPADRRN